MNAVIKTTPVCSLTASLAVTGLGPFSRGPGDPFPCLLQLLEVTCTLWLRAPSSWKLQPLVAMVILASEASLSQPPSLKESG